MIFDTRQNVRTRGFVERAARELAQADPTMAELIRRVGPCQLGMTRRNHYFPALVEAIIYQQLAGKAAAAILARFRALYSSRRFPIAAELNAVIDTCGTWKGDDEM